MCVLLFSLTTGRVQRHGWGVDDSHHVSKVSTVRAQEREPTPLRNLRRGGRCETPVDDCLFPCVFGTGDGGSVCSDVTSTTPGLGPSGRDSGVRVSRERRNGTKGERNCSQRILERDLCSVGWLLTESETKILRVGFSQWSPSFTSGGRRKVSQQGPQPSCALGRRNFRRGIGGRTERLLVVRLYYVGCFRSLSFCTCRSCLSQDCWPGAPRRVTTEKKGSYLFVLRSRLGFPGQRIRLVTGQYTSPFSHTCRIRRDGEWSSRLISFITY